MNEEYEIKKDFVEYYVEPLLAKIDPSIIEVEYKEESGEKWVQVKRLCFASNLVMVSKINITGESYLSIVKDCLKAVE